MSRPARDTGLRLKMINSWAETAMLFRGRWRRLIPAMLGPWCEGVLLPGAARSPFGSLPHFPGALFHDADHLCWRGQLLVDAFDTGAVAQHPVVPTGPDRADRSRPRGAR